VSLTTYDKADKDEERNIFKIPKVLEDLIEKKRLGQKTKEGFYKKGADGKLSSIDFKTGNYKPLKNVRFDCFRVAKGQQKTSGKLRALCS